ncbi:hypothetical protein [Qipengyuania sp. JC766]|uniref:hypothetical protein n=1 Tax=Qipengyuania sp. JC766 TaxID=3232139 RepID=UPI0034586B15
MKRGLFGLGAILVAASSGLANAQETAEAKSSDALTSIVDCRTITDDEQRLVCYDAAVSALQSAQQAKELVVVTRKDVREAQQGLFGLAVPRIKLFDEADEKSEETQELKEITSTIASFREARRGFVFTLPDGAVWEQTDNTYLGGMREGATVIIKRGALGSYFATVGSGRAARVKRLR